MYEALRLLFAHHVETEETEMFPRVEALLPASELRALGVMVQGSRPPVWVVTTEAHAAIVSQTDRSMRGVSLPSLREN